MLLYENPASGNCYKVRLLLAHLGIECERRELSVIDRSDRPEVLGALNPIMRVPTIVLDDGRPIGESGAILWYFGEETRFVPEDAYDRARMLQWMFFEQYEHEPSIAVLRFIVKILPEPGERSAQIPALTEAGHKALRTMETGLDGRAYFAGSSLSLADIALYGYTHVAHEAGLDLSPYPRVNAWLQRVAAEPGHIAMDS